MTMISIAMYAKYTLSVYKNIFVEIACNSLYRYRWKGLEFPFSALCNGADLLYNTN